MASQSCWRGRQIISTICRADWKWTWKFYFRYYRGRNAEDYKNGKIAVLVGTKSIRKYFKDNPFDLRPQILISDGNHASENFILTENSPLQPILTAELLKLRETGIMTILEKKWIGEKLESKVSVPLHNVVLSFGQTILIFVIIGGAIATSVCILGLEIFCSWITSINFMGL